MKAAFSWTLAMVLFLPAATWGDPPHNLDELESAVHEFCEDREALTKVAVAASKTEQRFQLASAIEEHRRKQRDLNERADELRAAASGEVLRNIVRLEGTGRDGSDARRLLSQLNAQLSGCAAVDDGFITWATQRTQNLTEDEERSSVQATSDDAYARHIARGVADARSLEERVVSITPPTVEQTVALYTEVNPERFVFAARALEELAAPGRVARYRRIVAGEAFLLTRAPANGRVQVLTIEGLQFDVAVSGISLTPLKGRKSAPIEPSWLRAADQPAAYMPLIPAIARLTGLFPLKR